MEELNKQIPAGFNIKPKSIIKSRLSYICRTDKGMRLIQKTQTSEEKLLFTHALKQHIEKSGFFVADKFYISNQNTPYYVFENETYIMTHFNETEDSDFTSSDDIKEIVRITARFHNSAKNFVFPKGKIYPGINLTEYFLKQLQKFKSIKKQLSSKSCLSDFDVLFIKNYDYFYSEAAEALDILKNSAYNKLYDNSIQKSYICHNALKEETVIKLKNKFSIISFENASAAPCLWDFADILNRYIRKHVPPAAEISGLIEIYNSENAITSDEVNVFYAILKFPLKYIKTCCDFCSKGLPFTPNSVINRMKTIIEQKERTKLYISK